MLLYHDWRKITESNCHPSQSGTTFQVV
jgi:hypothetical protein